MQAASRSLLRWAGSKRKLIPELAKFWTPGLRYVEPFAGSAALFFALKPKKALLGDVNGDLVDCFKTIKRDTELVYEKLTSLPVNSDQYYALRSLDSKQLEPVERAVRFLYLNRFCFNGIYRTNAAGKFNVPYSGTKTGGFPSYEEFKNFVTVLRAARIEREDFETLVLKNVLEGDFVYLDPPYALANRRVFRQYGPDSFGLYDLERLANLLVEIDCRGAAFVLSYAYCRESLEYFQQWPSQKLFCQRNVAGFGGSRRLAAEMIFTNIQ